MLRRALIALSPLPAIGIGCLVGTGSGAPPLAWAPNAAASALGMGALLALTSSAGARLKGRVSIGAAAGALLAIAATLLFPGSEGAHRWLSLGPVRLNASAALAPLVLLGIHDLASRRLEVAAGLALIAVGFHAWQPDAGQAIAVGIACAAMLLTAPGRRPVRLASALAIVSAAAVAWLRPDPLGPVPHVEFAWRLGLDAGPAFAGAMILAAALAVAPLAIAAVRRPAGVCTGLACYCTVTMLVPLAGFFPVPLFGAGAGPVLGWYLALGVSAARSRRGLPADQAPPPPPGIVSRPRERVG